MVKTMNETFPTGGTKWSFTYVRPQNAIRIGFTDAWITANPTSTFRILTDNDMRSGAFGNFTERDISRDFNEITKNFTDNQNYGRAFPFTSGFVDLNTVRNVYLCCSGLGNFQTLTLTGERNVVKKIPVNGVSGEVIYDQWGNGTDHLDCSQQTLSRLSFQLRDVFGRIIDARGVHWSFTIAFARVQNGH